MNALLLLSLAPLPALVIFAALCDLTTMKIPNWISGLLLLAFFPAALVGGMSPGDMGLHLAVCVAVLLAGMVMFALRWVGGGDAKLIAAVALWFGVAGIGPLLLSVALAGGAFSMGLLLSRRYVPTIMAAPQGWFGRLMEPKGDIPYGVAIAIGALAAYPASPLVAAFAAG